MPALAPKTLVAFKTAANHLERVLEPRPARQAHCGRPIAFHGQAAGRGHGRSHNRHHTSPLFGLRLSWGVDEGPLPVVPKMVIPKAGGARAGRSPGKSLTG